jgi:hypothetical protein
MCVDDMQQMSKLGGVSYLWCLVVLPSLFARAVLKIAKKLCSLKFISLDRLLPL